MSTSDWREHPPPTSSPSSTLIQSAVGRPSARLFQASALEERHRRKAAHGRNLPSLVSPVRVARGPTAAPPARSAAGTSPAGMRSRAIVGRRRGAGTPSHALSCVRSAASKAKVASAPTEIEGSREPATPARGGTKRRGDQGGALDTVRCRGMACDDEPAEKASRFQITPVDLWDHPIDERKSIGCRT